MHSCGLKEDGRKQRKREGRIIRMQNKMSCELSNQAPKRIALLTRPGCLHFFPSPFPLFSPTLKK